jgi:hypothetical protein
LFNAACPFGDDCHYAHGEDEINEGYQPNSDFLMDSDIFDPTAGRMDQAMSLPFPSTAKFSYFILQSPDLRALAVAKRRGMSFFWCHFPHFFVVYLVKECGFY